MNAIPLDIAVEDELSELVAVRLVGHARGRYHVGNIHRRGGYGYLKSKIRGWNSAAKAHPILVLTDLDTERCPVALQKKWLKRDSPAPNLMFRIAIREVEAWLLADWEAMLRFLEIPGRRARNLPAPDSTEAIGDPKAKLIELAAHSSRRELRAQILPRPGSTAKQGPEYNQCLASFVEDHWDINRASERNNSLLRTANRLRVFVPRYNR